MPSAKRYNFISSFSIFLSFVFLFCLIVMARASSSMLNQEWSKQGFPGGAGIENLPANSGDTGSSPGLGRSHMPRSN